MEPHRFSDEEYGRLVGEVQRLMEKAGQIPYEDVQKFVFDLLQNLDGLHREALTRLFTRVEAEAPALADALAADPAVHTLLTLYDLGPGIPEPPPKGSFVPLDEVDILEVFKRPIWLPGGRVEDLEAGTVAAREFEGVRVILCRVGDEVFALRDACVDSVLTLQQGTLDGHTLVCPWHGCRYDVRTGQREGDPGGRVPTFPVQVGENGRFAIGFNVD